MESFGRMSVAGTGLKPLIRCAGLGGCTSSMAAKKPEKVAKKPKTGIYKPKK